MFCFKSRRKCRKVKKKITKKVQEEILGRPVEEKRMGKQEKKERKYKKKVLGESKGINSRKYTQ